jgi:hypothetical protein
VDQRGGWGPDRSSGIRDYGWGHLRSETVDPEKIGWRYENSRTLLKPAHGPKHASGKLSQENRGRAHGLRLHPILLAPARSTAASVHLTAEAKRHDPPHLDSRFRKSQEPKRADDLVDQDSMKTLVSLAMV